MNENLDILFNKINDYIDYSAVIKHKVNFNYENNSINIGLRLNNDIILSINARGDLEEGIIGINIMRHRELLISDFIFIYNLPKLIDKLNSI